MCRLGVVQSDERLRRYERHERIFAPWGAPQRAPVRALSVEDLELSPL